MFRQAFAQKPTQVTVAEPLLAQALDLDGEIPCIALAILRVIPRLQQEAKSRSQLPGQCGRERTDGAECSSHCAFLRSWPYLCHLEGKVGLLDAEISKSSPLLSKCDFEVDY
jgi:hypothetical protein